MNNIGKNCKAIFVIKTDFSVFENSDIIFVVSEGEKVSKIPKTTKLFSLEVYESFSDSKSSISSLESNVLKIVELERFGKESGRNREAIRGL